MTYEFRFACGTVQRIDANGGMVTVTPSPGFHFYPEPPKQNGALFTKAEFDKIIQEKRNNPDV